MPRARCGIEHDLLHRVAWEVATMHIGDRLFLRYQYFDIHYRASGYRIIAFDRMQILKQHTGRAEKVTPKDCANFSRTIEM